jgi:copper transport protein
VPLRRVVVASLWVVAAAGSFLGPAAATALGHSELVASVPAAGDVVTASPPDIRLTFSEPIDPAHTSIDVLTGEGAVLLSQVGTADPGDPFTLVATMPVLDPGTYTVNWRALSAADGHNTLGTFSFGVGNVSPPPLAATGSAGSLHAGHDEGTAFLETESRIVGDLGFLVAAGLPVIGWLVLRRPRSTGLVRVGAVALLAGAVGAGGLMLLGGPVSGIDVASYGGTRTGQVQGARFAAAVACAGAGWFLSRSRPRLGLLVVGGAGIAGLVLVTLGSHAAAFADPAPVVAEIVHLGAAACWLTGLLALAWLVVLPEHKAESLDVLVPRFSGVAIVTVGLMAATGAYADWLETGTLISLDSPYQATLVAKVALTVAALAVGWFNYRSAGRDLRFGARVGLEAALAIGVVIATGLLSSGSPPGPATPIAIARVSSSALDQVDAVLTVSPGRPGPTEFTVALAAPPAADARVELELDRLDQAADTTLPLRPATDRRTWVAPGGLLPPNSRFDAAVIVRDAGGVEQGRSRFAFSVGTSSIVAGRAEPAIQPIAVVVVLLLAAAALAVGLLASGRTLPATDRRVGRLAMAAGSMASVLLAIVIARGGLNP